VNLLLDTHVLLWWLSDDRRLSAPAHRAIAEGANIVFVSVAALWEIRIKEAIGKLRLPDNFAATLDAENFEILDVKAKHVHALSELPLVHRDPFDRILISQAITEKLRLVTRDKTIQRYDVDCLVA
jgi:PIN domain nuclease of toxin-antitoxin system